jgi:hypothetical protein
MGTGDRKAEFPPIPMTMTAVAPAIDAAGSVVLFSSTQPAREDDLSTDFDLFLFQRLTSQASMIRIRPPSASNSK